MTVDREQVRRDERDYIAALLAKLEQAERERDEERHLRKLADAALESLGAHIEEQQTRLTAYEQAQEQR